MVTVTSQETFLFHYAAQRVFELGCVLYVYHVQVRIFEAININKQGYSKESWREQYKAK